MKLTWSKIALALGFVASSAAFNVAQAETLVAINSANQIGVFDSSNVESASFVGITGLAMGESFVGIDLRPSNNTIYGISSASKIYTVDAYTGAASFVSALSGYTINSSLGYGIDFNPILDRTANASLRVVTTAGDNLAVNANTGVVATQVPLKTTVNGMQTNVVATGFTSVAYNNSDPTQSVAPADIDLYYLNFETDTQSEALAAFNNPRIDLIGEIAIDILSAGGFEIFSRNGENTGFAAVNIEKNKKFESLFLGIDLETGAGTKLGKFKFDGMVTGLTSAPSAVPVPAAAWLFGSALIGFASFRRKSV